MNLILNDWTVARLYAWAALSNLHDLFIFTYILSLNGRSDDAAACNFIAERYLPLKVKPNRMSSKLRKHIKMEDCNQMAQSTKTEKYIKTGGLPATRTPPPPTAPPQGPWGVRSIRRWWRWTPLSRRGKMSDSSKPLPRCSVSLSPIRPTLAVSPRRRVLQPTSSSQSKLTSGLLTKSMTFLIILTLPVYHVLLATLFNQYQ